MADGWKFRPDEAGIKAVSTGPGVDVALNLAAQAAAARMRSLAAGMKSGSFFKFRSTIKAVKASGTGKERAAYAGSSSPGWHLQEFGTAHDRPHAVIRRGMKASGVRFEEGK